ncbi:hypothetical protein CRUP_030740 [Coryphaenoides rupestris]|nr:hypothetical protein CRUP_030740 [Coryphaenoides rupestris]
MFDVPTRLPVRVRIPAKRHSALGSGDRRPQKTQVPWWAGGWAFRLFRPSVLSLKSDVFSWEMSMSALATGRGICTET